MTIARRHLLALTASAAAWPIIGATDGAEPLPSWPPAERFPLWPAGTLRVPAGLKPAPEVTGKPGEYRDIQMHGTVMPDVGVFRPAKPDGRALLIIPGGGYSIVSLRNEGMDVARALTAHGVTCFVLSYRLPGEGWDGRADVPLSDAQRAMRLIRAGAARYWIDPARLGVLGFSAGGHLAGSLATQADTQVYPPRDAADRLSARPAYAGLMYAVSNVDAGRSHGGSRTQLLGPTPDPAMEARYAVERNVVAGTPPLFLLHAEDDDVVPMQNTLDTLAAARAAKVPVEAHLLERGGHGFGTRLPVDNPGSLWPELFNRWTLGR